MNSYFENLEVWKKSCSLAVKVYKLLKDCKDYGMRDQMLRSSVSVPSNIAEGSERNSSKEFQRFISIAKGSAAELRTQVYISKELGIFNLEDSDCLIKELKSISRMLQGLYDSLGKK